MNLYLKDQKKFKRNKESSFLFHKFYKNIKTIIGMKKTVVIVSIILGLILIVFILRGSEDSWIKDNKGVYVKHGVPSLTPDYVKEQKEAINCSFSLYETNKQKGMNFSSQCLGSCGNYAVDIVHGPRIDIDNLPENQCEDYKNGKISHFIELDKDRNIVRVI